MCVFVFQFLLRNVFGETLQGKWFPGPNRRNICSISEQKGETVTQGITSLTWHWPGTTQTANWLLGFLTGLHSFLVTKVLIETDTWNMVVGGSFGCVVWKPQPIDCVEFDSSIGIPCLSEQILGEAYLGKRLLRITVVSADNVKKYQTQMQQTPQKRQCTPEVFILVPYFRNRFTVLLIVQGFVSCVREPFKPFMWLLDIIVK